MVQTAKDAVGIQEAKGRLQLSPSVVVLMSTYNGGAYLREQLDSILSQTLPPAKLLVRDDGSTDDTLAILQEYADKGQLEYYTGENLGPALSYMDLLKKVPQADYYAFSDQDDVWLPEKIKQAVDALGEEGLQGKPAVYFGAPQLVDESLEPMPTPESFVDVTMTLPATLMSNKCNGCTMLFNHPLRDQAISWYNEDIKMHDWWVYAIALAQGAYVVHDEKCPILYRQHGSNVSGGTITLGSVFSYCWNALTKRPRYRSKLGAALAQNLAGSCPDDQLEVLEELGQYRRSLPDRMKLAADGRFKTGRPGLDVLFHAGAVIGII